MFEFCNIDFELLSVSNNDNIILKCGISLGVLDISTTRKIIFRCLVVSTRRGNVVQTSEHYMESISSCLDLSNILRILLDVRQRHQREEYLYLVLITGRRMILTCLEFSTIRTSQIDEGISVGDQTSVPDEGTSVDVSTSTLDEGISLGVQTAVLVELLTRRRNIYI